MGLCVGAKSLPENQLAVFGEKELTISHQDSAVNSSQEMYQISRNMSKRGAGSVIGVALGAAVGTVLAGPVVGTALGAAVGSAATASGLATVLGAATAAGGAFGGLVGSGTGALVGDAVEQNLNPNDDDGIHGKVIGGVGDIFDPAGRLGEAVQGVFGG
ncbi:hypothetical protein RvY_00446 [Ramazzottius varieornatus]|uniref:Uncharacterized protein n=1 Tax=Ramazzottius varieornatus TaxID=947166 RepID=A0A1D1UK45_RAMVA|nr:hypothetical protein RvY_00446 [Ramazzottius varieornatus]